VRLGGLIEQTHDRVPGDYRAKEAHTRLCTPHPDHSHREPIARPQFDGYAFVELDACHAAKTQTILRVVGDEDAPSPTVVF
jgi:hypothetical protein